MGRQYGSPPEDPRRKTGPGYTERKDPEPKAKDPDPSPPSRTVNEFHKNAAVDTRKEDIHHTIGIGTNTAASGSHNHRGGDSVLLLEGITISGAKAGNTALASVINALVELGAKDTTT